MDSICGGKPLAESNVSALKTNQQVIDYVVKNPDAMGVIGVNWLGNRSDTTNLSSVSYTHLSIELKPQ